MTVLQLKPQNKEQKVPMLLPQEIIRTKRDGGILSTEQIAGFVDGLVTGDFNDAQVGSKAMSIFQKGMNTEEIVTLTTKMMHSGDIVSWPGIDGPMIYHGREEEPWITDDLISSHQWFFFALQTFQNLNTK